MKKINDLQEQKNINELEQLRINKLESHLNDLEINAYNNGTGIFMKFNDRGSQSSVAFCAVVKLTYPKLSSIAERLSKIPAASAQLDRLFSSWAFVHSDLRNYDLL